MNKQIEEMARDICECYNIDGTCYQDDKPCDLRCEHFTDAQYLYEKGYRKQSENLVEVVRCKDCAYRVSLPKQYDYNGKPATVCIMRSKPVGENGYCSDGVKKKKEKR